MRKFLQSHKFHQAKYLNQSFRSFSTEKTFKIGIIPGDGIGKEVIPSAETVLKAIPPEFSGAKFEFVHLDAGFETFQKTGNSLPPATVEALRTCNGALFGAVSSPTQKVQGYSSPIVAMRKLLDLYGNLRPVISAPLHSSKQFVDLLIVRENTECLYVKKERLEDNGNKAIADRVITRSASTRIAELAFQRAQKRRNERPKTSKKQTLVTIVHKSNVLSVTDGLFRECCFEVAKKYPDIPVEEQIVDSMVYKLILEPQRYDVVVAPNLYGDILSDAGAALVGGLGIIPSANVSDAFALCEPVHGSAPDIAGKGIANPVAAIRSAALLLENLPNFPKGKLLSDLIEQNVAHTLRRGPKTPDLHEGRSTTSQVTETIVQKMLEDIQREQKK